MALVAPQAASAKRLVGLTDPAVEPARIVTFSDTNLSSLLSSAPIDLPDNQRPLALARRADGTYWLLLLDDMGTLTATDDTDVIAQVGLDGSFTLGPALSPGFITTDGFGVGASFGPDGLLHLVDHGGENRSVNVDTGAASSGPDISVSSQPATLAFSTNGTAFAYDWGNDTLITINLTTGVRTFLANSTFVAIHDTDTSLGMAITPDNAGYLSSLTNAQTSTHNPFLWRFNTATGAQALVGQLSAPVIDIAYLSEEPIPPVVPDTTAPAIIIAALKTAKNGRSVTTKITCPATEISCASSYQLDTTKAVATKKNAKKKKLKLGSGKATIAGGETKPITIRLSSKARKLLKKKHKIAATLTVTTTDAAGNRATAKKTGTIKKPKVKKKHKKK